MVGLCWPSALRPLPEHDTNSPELATLRRVCSVPPPARTTPLFCHWLVSCRSVVRGARGAGLFRDHAASTIIPNELSDGEGWEAAERPSSPQVSRCLHVSGFMSVALCLWLYVCGFMAAYRVGEFPPTAAMWMSGVRPILQLSRQPVRGGEPHRACGSAQRRRDPRPGRAGA